MAIKKEGGGRDKEGVRESERIGETAREREGERERGREAGISQQGTEELESLSS